MKDLSQFYLDMERLLMEAATDEIKLLLQTPLKEEDKEALQEPFLDLLTLSLENGNYWVLSDGYSYRLTPEELDFLQQKKTGFYRGPLEFVGDYPVGIKNSPRRQLAKLLLAEPPQASIKLIDILVRIVCPLTGKILKNPAIFSDQYSYERDVLSQLASTNNISNQYFENFWMLKFVAKVLTLYPPLHSLVFDPAQPSFSPNNPSDMQLISPRYVTIFSQWLAKARKFLAIKEVQLTLLELWQVPLQLQLMTWDFNNYSANLVNRAQHHFYQGVLAIYSEFEVKQDSRNPFRSPLQTFINQANEMTRPLTSYYFTVGAFTLLSMIKTPRVSLAAMRFIIPLLPFLMFSLKTNIEMPFFDRVAFDSGRQCALRGRGDEIEQTLRYHPHFNYGMLGISVLLRMLLIFYPYPTSRILQAIRGLSQRELANQEQHFDKFIKQKMPPRQPNLFRFYTPPKDPGGDRRRHHQANRAGFRLGHGGR